MFATDTIGAGLIIYNYDGALLVVRGPSKWSFPKGQAESCDGGPLATAIRECYEEVGLVNERDYELIGQAPFICVDRLYFFAQMKEGAEHNIRLQAEEVTDYRWLNPLKSCHYWLELNMGVRSYIRALQESN
jgi:8-oxo-dGTP pyrophosphatase MutT (NUDIX family)